MSDRNKTQYSYLKEILLFYWQSYGGMRALFYSPYLHVTVILSSIMWPIWTQADWWDLVINILPSVVGFSLGGYAIFTAFGDEDFKHAISGIVDKNKKKEYSPFIKANASFLHFIIIQLISLFLAVIAKARFYESLPDGIKCLLEETLTIKGFFIIEGFKILFWFSSFSLFVYALSLAFAATFAIFRMARWFDENVTIKKEIEKGCQKK